MVDCETKISASVSKSSSPLCTAQGYYSALGGDDKLFFLGSILKDTAIKIVLSVR